MIIFKFGGASLADAKAVKNVASIIGKYQSNSLLIVVSAMGKTTNAIEEIIKHKPDSELCESLVDELVNYHTQIAEDLFENEHAIHHQLSALFAEFKEELKKDYEYDKLYDQTIPYGELFSSIITAEYLKKGTDNTLWFDSRKCIKTNSQYRNGKVDWVVTAKNINEIVRPILQQNMIITQGFLGSNHEGFTTTLGREGSDYTAAIYANCLEANTVTVWKDVPGILNADPKLFDDAKLYDELPYQEAAEMTYYGASVIHPKTIKPLANKHIPLIVKSFIEPKGNGTVIKDCQPEHLHPAIIIKKNQCLVSLKVIDYTFVNEDNLSLIFHELAQADIKINLMQNSAISFSIALDNDRGKLEKLIDRLSSNFEIQYNTGLSLLTIKNYTTEMLEKYRKDKSILLEQISRNNYRALLAN